MALALFLVGLLAVLAMIGFVVTAVAAAMLTALVVLVWAACFGTLYVIVGEHNAVLALGLSIPLAALIGRGVIRLTSRRDSQ